MGKTTYNLNLYNMYLVNLPEKAKHHEKQHTKIN